MRLGIPYMDRILGIDLPEQNLLFDIAPRDVPPAADLAGTLRRALQRPIGSPALRALARPGQRAVVIADDNTRPTPTRQIVPLVLDELNAGGVADRDIRVIVASGTHRAMTDAEVEAKYGEPVLSRVTVECHRYRGEANLVECGLTQRGTRILANRRVMEADLRVGIGNIVPHHPTGWSGGAKIVLPGVAGEETVAQMHLLGSRDPALGRLDTEMRREMEEFAERIGLDFIVNVILNRDGLLVDAVAGHFIQAHRVGVEKARQVFGIPIPGLADVAISSTSPVDFDFFQADKGLFAAEPAVRAGGEIILVSGCVEGISPAHPELAEMLGPQEHAQATSAETASRCGGSGHGRLPDSSSDCARGNDRIWALLRAGEVSDPLTAAEAITLNDLKSKVQVTLATEGLAPEHCAAMGFRHIAPGGLAGYLRQRLATEPGLRIGILRQSAEVLPLLVE